MSIFDIWEEILSRRAKPVVRDDLPGWYVKAGYAKFGYEAFRPLVIEQHATRPKGKAGVTGESFVWLGPYHCQECARLCQSGGGEAAAYAFAHGSKDEREMCYFSDLG
jgi:hypothetical protein